MIFFRVFLLSIVLLVAAPSGRAEESPTAAYLAAQQLSLPAQFDFQQQRFIRGLPRPLASSGELSITTDLIQWHTQQPVAQQLTISASGIIDVQQGQAIRGGEVVASILLAVLSGNTQTLEQHFAMTMNNDCAQLTPRAAALSQFIARIDTCGSPQLERVELHERNGNYSIITLTPSTADAAQSG